MAEWIVGDVHVHSDHCGDGTLSVSEIVERAMPYCDFIAISGHARQSDNWGAGQYEDIVRAREQFPGFPIFHTGELEFPIPRHAMVLATPDDGEFDLQRELVRRFDRLAGVAGIDMACQAMQFVENWSERQRVVVFNHPNAPDVAFEDLDRLAAYDSFKVVACYDRGERRAPQTWDVGAEWDRLLTAGHRVWTRFGSDFHKHFVDGGNDYYPGEFVQDNLYVQDRSYRSILAAYRSGSSFCTVNRIVSELTVRVSTDGLAVSFVANHPIERLEVVSDGRVVAEVHHVGSGPFRRTIPVGPGRYYRLRGIGAEQERRYTSGTVTPVFVSNPVFWEGLAGA